MVDNRHSEHQLPLYSSERFYLLSLIQDSGCDLTFAAALTSTEKEVMRGTSGTSPSLLVTYLLLDLAKEFGQEVEVAAAIVKLRALVAHSDAVDNGLKNRFLEIDVIVRGSMVLGRAFANELLQRIDGDSVLGILSGRAISLSDKPAACPGLDRIACRYAQRLPHGTMRLLAESRYALLGAEPDAEPDAAQGVDQLTIGDIDPSMRVVESQFLPLQSTRAIKVKPSLLSLAMNMAAMTVLLTTIWTQLPADLKSGLLKWYKDIAG